MLCCDEDGFGLDLVEDILTTENQKKVIPFQAVLGVKKVREDFYVNATNSIKFVNVHSLSHHLSHLFSSIILLRSPVRDHVPNVGSPRES